MPDHHYENKKLAAIYDIDSPWSIDRDFYLALAGPEKKTILDLGCGTGLICEAYAAQGHDVTGVDPSRAMLDVARQKQHGDQIEWVQSFSQTYQSDKRFDLIIMTGHAFQVLIDDADIQATCDVMRRHLKPNGIVVFESRNPHIDWAKNWNYDMDLQLPDYVVHESRRFLKMENEHMTFELTYRFPDENLVSESSLRFLPKDSIVEHLSKSGLQVKNILGDWDGSTFDERKSHEIIIIAKIAD